MRYLGSVVLILATTAAAQQPSLGDLARRNRKPPVCKPPVVALVGKAAPALKFDRVHNGSGETVSRRRGKPQLVGFWSINCPPCVAALPKVDAIARSFDSLQVVLVHPEQAVRYRTGLAGFPVADPATAAEVLSEFIDGHKIRVPVAIARDSEFISYGVQAVPLYVLIDGRGVVRYQSCTLPTRELIAEVVSR